MPLSGRRIQQPGQFYGVHSIAVDSKGNIYTTETYEGKTHSEIRLQGHRQRAGRRARLTLAEARKLTGSTRTLRTLTLVDMACPAGLDQTAGSPDRRGPRRSFSNATRSKDCPASTASRPCASLGCHRTGRFVKRQLNGPQGWDEY